MRGPLRNSERRNSAPSGEAPSSRPSPRKRGEGARKRRENEFLRANGIVTLMRNTKKKSSGWRAPDERGTWQERHARRADAQVAKARRDCDELRLWRSCPARRCLRARGCTGQPRDCLDRHRLKQNSDAAPRPQPTARAAAETAQHPASIVARQTPGPAPTAAQAPKRPAYIVGNHLPGPVPSASEAAAAIAASIAAMPPERLLGEEIDALIRGGAGR